MADKFGVDELLDGEEPVLDANEFVEGNDDGLTEGVEAATVTALGSSRDVESTNGWVSALNTIVDRNKTTT